MKQNGWDFDEFQATVEAVKENPEAGRLTFRTRFDWDEGFAGDARTEEIEQLGETIRRKFTFRGDHPPELLGKNTGATAVETLLCSLGSCIAGTYAAHATAKGVTIDELTVELEGKIDLNGFLQLSSIRPGLSGLSMKVQVRSDADEELLREVFTITEQASPVYDSLCNPVTIQGSVQKIQ